MSEDFEKLLGKTLISIEGAEVGSEEIEFVAADGSRLALYHPQECCEAVEVVEVIGDVADLIGAPIGLAELSVFSNETPPEATPDQWHDEEYEWAFYKLATVKGHVTIRWLGSSNGYYGVSVSCRYSEVRK